MVKQLMGRRRLYKVTEWRDGAVYKTEFIKELWIKLSNESGLYSSFEQRIAQEAGGDMLGSCSYDGRDHIQRIDTEKLWIPCDEVAYTFSTITIHWRSHE